MDKTFKNDVLDDYKEMSNKILNTINYWGINTDSSYLSNILLDLWVQAKNLLDYIDKKRKEQNGSIL